MQASQNTIAVNFETRDTVNVFIFEKYFLKKNNNVFSSRASIFIETSLAASRDTHTYIIINVQVEFSNKCKEIVFSMYIS